MRLGLVVLVVVSGCAVHHVPAGGAHAAAAVSASPPPSSGGAAVRGDVSVRVDPGLLEFGVRALFFGIPVAPPTAVAGDPGPGVVFVLDRSGSMGKSSAAGRGAVFRPGGDLGRLLDVASTVNHTLAGHSLQSKLELAKAELVQTLRALPDGSQFNVLFFDDQIVGMGTELLTMNAQTRVDAEGFVRQVGPGRQTAAVPALRAAYGTGARRVVLLSDGLANRGGGADQLLFEARQAMQAGVRFDTVGLGADQDFSLLQTLAHESGGMAVIR